MLLDEKNSTLLLIDMQEKLVPLVAGREALIKDIKNVLKLANQCHIPLMTSLQYPKGLGQTIDALTPYLSESKTYEKTTFSCLGNADFVKDIKESDREQYVLIGIETHACVMQTAIELHQRNKAVFVVTNATSSRHEKDKALALSRMDHLGITLISQEMLFFEWIRDSKRSDFKALSQLFLQ